MDDWNPTLRRVGSTLGYGLLGTVGTALSALVAVNLATPLQPVVYDLFYLRVGPSEATEAAIVGHFLLSAGVALAAATLAGDAFGARGTTPRRVGAAVAGALLPLVVFLALSLAGLAAILTALVLVVGSALAVPLLLRYRYDVGSGTVATFVGGVPVVVLLVLLAGFGLGWGWGYTMTATEVPASEANGSAAAFDEAPQVRDDLLGSGDCETTPDDRRRCHLSLREYDHEVAAVRFMARHGVRCPYGGRGGGANESFVAEHDGTYYRVTCTPHGD